MTGEPLSLRRKISLGVGDFGFNFYWQSTSIFLLFFYTDVLGIPSVVAGLIYMIALIWDLAVDPIVGLIADRTRSRFGRYRPYLVLGAVPLGMSFVAMFCTPKSPAMGAVALAAGAHVLFRTLYAVVAIPYTSLFARVTRDSAERSDLAGVRMIFATLGAVAVSALTFPAVKFLGGNDAQKGWTLLAAAYAALGTLLIWFVAWAARGCDIAGSMEGVPRKPRELVASLLANRPLHVALGVVLVSSYSSVFFMKNIIYYFKYVVREPAQASAALTLMALGTAAMVPVWTWAARAFGKRPAWVAGFVLSLTGLLLWRLADGHGSVWLYAALLVVAAGTSASYVCFWAVAPDTVEYGEWRTGVRAESLVFGFITLGQKAALGVGAGSLGFALRRIGYQANAEQSAATLAGLKSLMLFVPATGTLIALVLLAFYHLDANTHGRMVREIDARAAGGEERTA